MNDKQKLYDKWVDKVMAYVAEVGPKINRHVAAMQSKPFFDRQCDILFLGINPAESWDYSEKDSDADRQRFYDGNGYPPEVWGKRWDWAFNPENTWNSFTKCGWGDAVKQGNYLFSNILFFGSLHGGTDINAEDVRQKCAEFTAEMTTDIFRPRCVICFSVPKVFNRLNGILRFDNVQRMNNILREDGKPMRHRVMQGEKDGIRFYGVPHLTGFWAMTKADFDAIVAAIHKDMCNH